MNPTKSPSSMTELEQHNLAAAPPEKRRLAASQNDGADSTALHIRLRGWNDTNLRPSSSLAVKMIPKRSIKRKLKDFIFKALNHSVQSLKNDKSDFSCTGTADGYNTRAFQASPHFMITIDMPTNRTIEDSLVHLENILDLSLGESVQDLFKREKPNDIAKIIESCIMLQENSRFDFESFWVSSGTTHASQS